jgi:hypothetical protein
LEAAKREQDHKGRRDVSGRMRRKEERVERGKKGRKRRSGGPTSFGSGRLGSRSLGGGSLLAGRLRKGRGRGGTKGEAESAVLRRRRQERTIKEEVEAHTEAGLGAMLM